MSEFFISSTAAAPPPQVPTSFVTDNGTAVPAANVLIVHGTTTLAGTSPLSTSGAGNTVTVLAQISQAIAATDSTKIGLAAFDNTKFTVDANGFVSTSGTAIANTITGNSGGALSPSGGNWNIFGGTQIASSKPITTIGSGNTLTVTAQFASPVPASNALAVGLAAFNSAQFTVDGSGFVSLSSTIPLTITGDSGGALTPVANNWNILGRAGSKTSGSGSTLTIKSPPYSDQGGSTTVTLNSGSFATAAITLTLPASAGLADGDLFEFVCTTASALVIQAVGSQKIRIGTLLSSAAGTATSTNIGDAVKFRFRAADGFFYATSVIGTWLIA